MRTQSLLLALLVTGCATTEEKRDVSPAVPEAEAKQTAQPAENLHQPIGWTPLPKGLEADPTKVNIPKLDFSVVKPEKLQLDNGIQVYLMQDRAVPLVNVRAHLVLGTFDEPADKLGVADALFDLMVSGGAGKLDADALDELLEFHAANAYAGAGEELSSAEINMRSEDVDKLLPVFADMVLRPSLQKDRFQIHISRSIEGVKRRVDSPDGLAWRALRKSFYGPMSVFAREKTEKTLKALTIADVQAFHKRLTPKGTYLLVTGDFDKEKMLALLKAQFGGWKGGEVPKRDFAAQAPLQKRVILVPKEAAQTKIRIALKGYKRLDPEEYAIRIMTTALGGGIGAGRLYREVRDTYGLAYSAWSGVYPGPTTGLFVAGVDTKPEQTARALEETLKILSGIKGQRPFEKKELQLASDMFLNSFAFRFDEPEKIVREKSTFDFFGYPDDYLDKYRDNIAKVDEKATLAAANRIITENELQIIVVGPPSKMGDLSKFGPVTTISDVEAFK